MTPVIIEMQGGAFEFKPEVTAGDMLQSTLLVAILIVLVMRWLYDSWWRR